MRSSRRVAAAAGGAFASFHIFYTSAPTSLSASTPSAGLRVGIVMLIVVAVQPFVPLLSQYVSTRGRMVTAALAAMGAGSLALPAGGHWLEMALLGLGFGVFVVASTAWAKETARPELLGKALGVYGFGASIGGAVGAPIGLWLAQTVGVFGTAVAGGILAFGSVLVALPIQTVPETTGGVTRSEDTESTRPGFQSGATLVALGGNLLAVTVYASALTSLSSGGTGLPSWLLILATLGIQVSLAFGRLTGGWATNTWAPFHIGAPTLALLVGAAAAFASFTAPWQKLAFSIVVGVVSGATQTIALTILMNQAGTTATTSRASAAWNLCFDKTASAPASTRSPPGSTTSPTPTPRPEQAWTSSPNSSSTSTTSTISANQPNDASSTAPCSPASLSTTKRTPPTHPSRPQPASSPTPASMPRPRSPQKQNLPRHQAGQVSVFSSYVELRGIEPLTFSLRTKRSTN